MNNAGSLQVQKSYRKDMLTDAGTLYLVGTPIGNLDDMTFRAVQTLKEADWVAAEDTRHTRKLLTHFGISARMISYHEHNKDKSGVELMAKLKAGDTVALVSDAGMPVISDPGEGLAAMAIEEGIHVVPIPGPNAAITALIASGLPADAFTFLGFLPREKKKAASLLETWKSHPATLLFYEAPHRIAATLQLLLDEWGDRPAVLARELTKRYEEFARGSLETCLQYIKEQGAMGEYCLIVAGNDAPDVRESVQWWTELTPEEHVAAYEREKGLTPKEAIKSAAADRGVPKRELYNTIHRK